MAFDSLVEDVWFGIIGMLTIKESFALYNADPRRFGAFIEENPTIRYRNVMNSAPSTLFLRVVLSGTDYEKGLAKDYKEYSLFREWLRRKFLKSYIAPPSTLFPIISTIIALKDCGFVGVSSIPSDWRVTLKTKDQRVCLASWNLVYRASLFGFDATEFHKACDSHALGGNYVVVVRAENGRIAAAYNRGGFSSDGGSSSNCNGFIMAIGDDGSCGAQFYRNEEDAGEPLAGICNFDNYGPVFNTDLAIGSNCHENVNSTSRLGMAYGWEDGVRVNPETLFGIREFRVSEYEVFKVALTYTLF
jgi:hypothetical protein